MDLEFCDLAAEVLLHKCRWSIAFTQCIFVSTLPSRGIVQLLGVLRHAERAVHARWRNDALPWVNGRLVRETFRKIAIRKGDANLKERFASPSGQRICCFLTIRRDSGCHHVGRFPLGTVHLCDARV